VLRFLEPNSVTTNLLSSQWNFSAPPNVYRLKYLKDTYNSESIDSIGFSDDNELPTHRKKEILRSTKSKSPHKTRLPFLCVILKRACDNIRMLNIGSFFTGSESNGIITSTGHYLSFTPMGSAKIFLFFLGILFIVLAIRIISSQNNGFLLGVRPRDGTCCASLQLREGRCLEKPTGWPIQIMYLSPYREETMESPRRTRRNLFYNINANEPPIILK